MDEQEAALPQRAVSLPNLIGWVSLCLLAAALGRTLDSRWQAVWAYAGGAGLVAAVGLKSLEKTRKFREERRRANAKRLRFEGRLTHLIDQSANLGPINDAIVELARHAKEQQETTPLRPTSGNNQRILGQLFLEIIPVEDRCATYKIAPNRKLCGRLRNISVSAVSFEHELPFDEPMVLLLFKLGHNKQLYLAVDIRWTQSTENVYLSGGAVIDAGDRIPQGFKESP